MVDAAITVSWDSDKLSNVERQRGFPFVDQNTTYGQSATGPARSTLKRPEVREAICASERANDDNGPDRRFVCYIVRHLHTQREKERRRERELAARYHSRIVGIVGLHPPN